MKLLTIFTYMVIGTIFFSCNTATQEKNNEPVAEEEPKQEQSIHVELNDGKRWEANIETTQGIKEMQKTIIAFMNIPAPDSITYKNIGFDLKASLDGIIKNCSMEGKAHEQLHNYLIPIVELIEKIQQERTRKIRRHILKLDAHLYKYSDYFFSNTE